MRCYQIARVAVGYGQDPRVVATEWAWADVLIWEAALDELQRVDGLAEAEQAVTAASLTALAFHEPKGLAERRAALQAAGRLPGAPLPDTEAVVASVTAVAERLALAERVARRQRRRGAAVAPFLKVMA